MLLVFFPPLYLVPACMILRTAWKEPKKRHTKIFITGVTLIIVLWPIVFSTIQSYLTYIGVVQKLASSEIISTKSSVDSIYVDGDYDLTKTLAKSYNTVYFHTYSRDKVIFLRTSPPDNSEIYAQKYIDLDVWHSQVVATDYYVTKTREDLPAHVSIELLTVRSKHGELLGTHTSVLWWGRGINTIFELKEGAVHSSNPPNWKESEEAFVRTVLSPTPKSL